jgi:hypothetical protein
MSVLGGPQLRQPSPDSRIGLSLVCSLLRCGPEKLNSRLMRALGRKPTLLRVGANSCAA